MGSSQARVRPPATIGGQDEVPESYLTLDEKGWGWAVTDERLATVFRKHGDDDHNKWFTVARDSRQDWTVGYYLSANFESCYGVGVYSEWRNACYWVFNDTCESMQCCQNGSSDSHGKYMSCQEGMVLCKDVSPSPHFKIKMQELGNNEICFLLQSSMDVTRWKADLINDIERVRFDPMNHHDPLEENQLRITSMNVKNVEDDWHKRRTPLIDCMKGTYSDIYNLQESASEQRAFFEEVLSGFRRKTDRWIDHGLQTCVNESALASRNYRLTNRTYQRFAYVGVVHIRGFLVEKLVKGDVRILVLNTHLHWTAGSSSQRLAQTRALLAWLEDPPADFEWNAVILTGDFNGEPGEPFYEELVAAGFTSAMKIHYQRELPTYKMGDVMTGKTSHEDVGEPFAQTLDYIWYKGELELELVSQIGTKSIDAQGFLFPSDHAGLVATFRV